MSCQGKLSYRGPIAPRSGGLPRIKLDLTPDELLVLPPVERVIFHEYSDAPAEGIAVLCYAYEEAFAEKVRALGDRGRPRDLYDVINLYRNAEARPRAAVLLDVRQQKCEHRSLAVPTLGGLETHKGDLEGSWQPMLGHQLQALPPVENFWEALPEFFAWLQTGVTPVEPATYRMAAGETLLRERTLRLPVPGRVQSYLEIIRFAASKRSCVDLAYQGSVRKIEPYSLRRTRDGNIVLHAAPNEPSMANTGATASTASRAFERPGRASFLASPWSLPRRARPSSRRLRAARNPLARLGGGRVRHLAEPGHSLGRTVRDTSTSAPIAASVSPLPQQWEICDRH